MELAESEKDLLKNAMELESNKLAKIQFIPAHVTGLDGLLRDAYVRQCPKSIDYHNRRDMIRIFNIIAKEIYGNSDRSPVVEEYGSFVMDIFDRNSDLDLSINFKNSIEVPRTKKIEILRKFTKKLYSIQRNGHVTGIQPIMTARVPIIKVTDTGTGIECDLSVDNRDGIAKSHIIHAISAIDERFRGLSFLMKAWAKAHDINSSRDRTLNSLSIVSLVAFHLQTCNPPILPPFSALLKEGADPASVAKVVKTYLSYGKKNKESVAKLFITLFVKLASVEKLWENGLCASLYEGSWILKSWGQHSYPISIEDFTDRSQNVARAVGPEQVKTIYRSIYGSLDYLLQFLNGQMQGVKLMDLLFQKQTVSALGDGSRSRINEIKMNLPTLQNPRPPKRRRLEEGLMKDQVQGLRLEKGLLKDQVQESREINYFAQDFQGTKLRVMSGRQPPLGETVHNALTSFTPSVLNQPPLNNIKGHHHGYGPGIVPSPFSSNTVSFERFYNPSVQSQLVPSQGSQSSFNTLFRQSQSSRSSFETLFRHKAAASNPHHRPVHSHIAQLRHNGYDGGHTFYHHRSD